MKKKFLNKFTIIDIIIIICIIGAIGFAVYHMTIDTDNGTSVSFDTSTANKLVETYLNFYKDGNIITSQVTGTNASSGENITLNGTVVWVGDTLNGVEVIINSNRNNMTITSTTSSPSISRRTTIPYCSSTSFYNFNVTTLSHIVTCITPLSSTMTIITTKFIV